MKDTVTADKPSFLPATHQREDSSEATGARVRRLHTDQHSQTKRYKRCHRGSIFSKGTKMYHWCTFKVLKCTFLGGIMVQSCTFFQKNTVTVTAFVPFFLRVKPHSSTPLLKIKAFTTSTFLSSTVL